MDKLARALVNAAAFLELSGDDVVDPDSAVAAMEDIVAALAGASPEEVAALKSAASAEREARAKRGADEDTLDFFENFLENFGVGDEE
jgi:hypothetical protein